MIYALLFLILFALLFRTLRFLFALSLVGAVVLLGEAHAYDGSRTETAIMRNYVDQRNWNAASRRNPGRL